MIFAAIRAMPLHLAQTRAMPLYLPNIRHQVPQARAMLLYMPQSLLGAVHRRMVPYGCCLLDMLSATCFVSSCSRLAHPLAQTCKDTAHQKRHRKQAVFQALAELVVCLCSVPSSLWRPSQPTVTALHWLTFWRTSYTERTALTELAAMAAAVVMASMGVVVMVSTTCP